MRQMSRIPDNPVNAKANPRPVAARFEMNVGSPGAGSVREEETCKIGSGLGFRAVLLLGVVFLQGAQEAARQIRSQSALRRLGLQSHKVPFVRKLNRMKSRGLYIFSYCRECVAAAIWRSHEHKSTPWVAGDAAAQLLRCCCLCREGVSPYHWIIPLGATRRPGANFGHVAARLGLGQSRCRSFRGLTDERIMRNWQR